MSVACRFIYRFKKRGSDETREIVVESTQSSFNAYQIARSKMLNRMNMDIRSFESQWQVEDSEVAMGVSSFPDDTDLSSEIQDISGVKSVKEESSQTNRITYLVDLESHIHEDYIIDKIKTIITDIKDTSVDDTLELLFVFDPDY